MYLQVGMATKELHARLTKLDENWKNNEIAEKIKQQKDADMALLQTRWKNGVLNEDDNDRDTVVGGYVNNSLFWKRRVNSSFTCTLYVNVYRTV